MTPPTFAGIDFGFLNGDEAEHRGFVKVLPGVTEKRRSEFAFPAIDGVTVQPLGLAGQTIIWHLTLVVKDEDTFAVVEAALAAARDLTVPQTMVYHGKTLNSVELVEFPEVQPMLSLASPWVAAKFYQLVFRNLTP